MLEGNAIAFEGRLWRRAMVSRPHILSYKSAPKLANERQERRKQGAIRSGSDMRPQDQQLGDCLLGQQEPSGQSGADGGVVSSLVLLAERLPR